MKFLYASVLTTALLAIGPAGYAAVADDVAARQEGQVMSVGMPDSWANWKQTW